jgi:acyl carrier protein
MTTTTADQILDRLQHAYDLVKQGEARTLVVDDHLVDDLELDSLDVIDLISVLEEDFHPEVIEAVVDRAADLATVRDLVDAFIAAG